jgi:phosphoglycolate phosphatase
LEAELLFEFNGTEIRPGVIDMLTSLRKQGIPAGIYTNTHYPKEFVHRLLAKFGLEKLIDQEFVMVSSTEGVKKPSAETIKMLAKKISVPPQQFAFVGNSPDDWLAAFSAKAIPVRLLYPGEYPKEEKALLEWKNFYDRIL